MRLEKGERPMGLIEEVTDWRLASRQEPVVLHHGEGAQAVYPGRAVTTLLYTARDSEGHVGVSEVEAVPGCVVPPHIHYIMNEQFYMLEGEMEFLAGSERIVAGPGTFLAIPRGLLHAWGNLRDRPARALIMFSPDSNRDRYFRRVAEFMQRGHELAEAERYLACIADQMRSGNPPWKDMKEQLDIEFDSFDPEPRVRFP